VILAVLIPAVLSGCAGSIECASGNALACARLGDASYRGGQEGADLDAAQGYFDRSCQKDFLPGCHGLGLVARAQQRLGDATRLLTDACKRGYGPSCTSAGDLQRARTPKQPELAAKLYESGCQLLDAEGCLQLAFLEEAGIDGTPDPERARSHYEIALTFYRYRCQQGYGDACYRYAEFFAKGWGIDTNEFQARRLMEKSCAFGHAPGCEYNASAR
jgi:TPR repeat protein